MKTDVFFLYPDRTDVTVKAYLLDDSPELLNGQKRPGVIICPGGAYVFCSDREAEPVAMRFLAMGYHAFVLRYSTFNGMEGKTWPEDVSQLPDAKEETVYPIPLVELGKTMLLVREHADEWFVDETQIGVCGFSAGGHNSALYASSWNKEFLSEALHTEKENLKPAFCILGYPFIDYCYHSKLKFDDYIRQSYDWMYLDYFGTSEPTEEAMILASANEQVTDENPPTFIWATSTDQSVPISHSLRMAQALADKNVPFELHIFGEGQHGLVLGDESTAHASDEINDIVQTWVEMAVKWVRKQAILPIERK